MLAKFNMHSRLANFLLLASAILFAGSVWGSAPLLPDPMASHFGASGAANDWTTRTSYLWSITLLGFGIPAFVIGFCFGIRFFPASTLNVPRADFWRSAEHHSQACRILLDWSFYLGAASFLWATLLHGQVVMANQLNPPALAPGPVFCISGMYLAVTGALVIMLIRRFARPER